MTTQDNYDDHQPQTVGVELPSKLDEILYEYQWHISLALENISFTKDYDAKVKRLQTKAKQAIQALIAQEVNKARIELLNKIYDMRYITITELGTVYVVKANDIKVELINAKSELNKEVDNV